MNVKFVGLCIGSSSISFYDGKTGKSIPHNGNPVEVLSKLVPEFLKEGLVVVTGRKARKLLNLPQISEVEATEIAFFKVKDRYDGIEAIVSAGGENFVLYRLNDKGRIVGIFTGNKCASGTGEFFLQQIDRMGLDLSRINEIETDEYYELSSRCSVFCKSDCTHALNKGVPKEFVLNGLGRVMAERIAELVHKARVRKIMIVGGTTRNKLMLRHLSSFVDFVIPEEALFFEAFGAYHWAREYKPSRNGELIFNKMESSFPKLEKLSKYAHMVDFKDMDFQKAKEGDVCILGVDVGSTTTKAVLMRVEDEAILASSYLRTKGDPVGAARKCYKEILDQLDVNVKIIAVGVTGSGRKIVGLHAQTDAVYNEIMAHARAAVKFDPEADTIFEIGGQDAKYTYLVNGVPTDYAMNEACSAGTGSFLEEAAKESLNVHYTDIGDLALKSENPPNFSDQCAAFIGSDVKTAIHEGISKEDICAGLVYSICMNYINRVKGNRPVGKKVFMQGGVCYNRAVPVAMAVLTGKRIVVPPHPGLMGAYGVALMVKDNLKLGFLKPSEYSLKDLIERDVIYRGSFICPGGKERCDRKCPITIIEIDGKRFPFGGACNRYENIRKHVNIDIEKYNYVKKREDIVFQMEKTEGEKKIALSKSLIMNSLFPLFSTFFQSLGFEVVVPERSLRDGWERKNAEFCFPVELSHGYMLEILKKDVDYIFLPRIRGMKVENSKNYNVFCPFVQSEADWLRSAFPELESRNVIVMNFDFSRGFEKEEEKFLELSEILGKTREEGKEAFRKALEVFKERQRKIKELGKEFLKQIEEEEFGVVLLGRSYNAFSSDANLGIPEKFASRGIPIVPFEALPYEGEEGYENMYWTWGEMITKAARFIKKHPKLFALYITNFSCGPDSFIISYFKDIMGTKPSLILELDSHTADAGIETRVEAFIDVVKSFLKVKKADEKKPAKRPKVVGKGKSLKVLTPEGVEIPLSDEKVKLVFPSMGEFGTKALAASFRYHGLKTEVCPPSGDEEFKYGRGNSLSKECLPLQLTLGSLIKYLKDHENEKDLILYFMPNTSGPCRFGQYSVYMDLWLRNNNVDNVALLSLNSENAYAGLGASFKLRAWVSIVISDVLFDVGSALRVLAKDKREASRIFEGVKDMVLDSLANDPLPLVFKKLQSVADIISCVEKDGRFEEAPKVLITGEIFVRWDEFSRKNLEKVFEENGIITHISPVHEWIYYTDYLFLKRYTSPDSKYYQRLLKKIEMWVKRLIEMKIKKIFERTGIYEARPVDIEDLMKSAGKFLHPNLTGEAILTIGTALHEVISEYDGVVLIGPFGCMPSRIAEAITKRGMETIRKRAKGKVKKVMEDVGDIPITFLESDGNPFTPIMETRIEAFMVQVKRVRRYLNSLN